MQNMNGKTALGLDNNVGAMLTYLPICGISLIYSIIVLITDKTNKNVRFHAVQSLLLMAAYFVVVFVVGFIGGVLAAITNSAALSGLTFVLYMIVFIAFLGLMIYGCVKAYQGDSYRLPVIGDLADKWSN